MENTSPKFTIDLVDIWKTLRGVLITIFGAAAWAVIAFLTSNFQTWDYVVHLTLNGNAFNLDLAFLAIPVLGGLIEIARRWLTAHDIPASGVISLAGNAGRHE